jgi:hypothetical protein
MGLSYIGYERLDDEGKVARAALACKLSTAAGEVYAGARKADDGDPHVREVGHVDWEAGDGVAGIPLQVGVDYDTVTIGSGEMTWRLGAAQVEELAQLLVSATWEAAAHQGGVLAALEAEGRAGAP